MMEVFFQWFGAICFGWLIGQGIAFSVYDLLSYIDKKVTLRACQKKASLDQIKEVNNSATAAKQIDSKASN